MNDYEDLKPIVIDQEVLAQDFVHLAEFVLKLSEQHGVVEKGAYRVIPVEELLAAAT